MGANIHNKEYDVSPKPYWKLIVCSECKLVIYHYVNTEILN